MFLNVEEVSSNRCAVGKMPRLNEFAFNVDAFRAFFRSLIDLITFAKLTKID